MTEELQSQKYNIESEYKINARKVQNGENPNALDYIGIPKGKHRLLNECFIFIKMDIPTIQDLKLKLIIWNIRSTLSIAKL